MSDVVLTGRETAVSDQESHTVVSASGDTRRGANRAFRVHWLWRSLILIKTVLLSPFLFFLAVRRSMTGASATLLVISIVSLNIIWGYPWTGMFAACVSLMLIGAIVNQFMRPRLKLDFSLPRVCVAGQTFSVVTHLTNRRQLPALDLRVGFRRAAKRRKTVRKMCVVETPDHKIDQILPSENIDLSASMHFDHRGIKKLPDIEVKSMFPFHLFRSTTILRSETSIAIAPRPLTGDEDSVSRDLLQALGGWSHKLLAGDALDYTGSREYQPGMPVRRWDFASWARLGRPIVREFQSPSVQMVSLLVDTSADETVDNKRAAELLERVLSVAATAIADLSSKAVRIRLYVTHEQPAKALNGDFSHGADTDVLLIRLAGAKRVSASVADDHTRDVLDRLGNDPMLVLTSRADLDVADYAKRNLTLLRVDVPRAGPGTPKAMSRVNDNTSQAPVTNGRSM